MLWRAPTDLSETSGAVIVLDERCPVCTMSGWILPVDADGVCLVCDTTLQRHTEGHWQVLDGTS